MKDLIRRIRATWYPNEYHGWGLHKNYFEGWYYKIVDPTERYAFAVIPGISMSPEGIQKAFIQRLDGKACTSDFHHFPAASFQPADDRFELSIADNSFSAERIQLNLPELQGTLHFHSLYSWPKMLGAPGIMGWYSFVPFMECYHGVVSMDHQLEGRLTVYGKTVDFTGGRGYMEKDWGRSFPSSWIWTQSNHFDADRRIFLMASVARIPWVGSYFIGCIVGFLLDDRLYRFATYTGAKMQIALEEKRVHLTFKDKKYRLQITAEQGSTGALVSPISGDMTGKVNESMQAILDVTLSAGTEILYQGSGRNAGLEVAGPVEELVEGAK
ncbi:MAG: tocopherol cyclase family protein [Saprospiraceae bacterium]|nr:hypothetical protein [Lewinella sp.]